MTGICSRQQVKTQNPPVRLTRPEFYQESDFTPQVGGFFPVKPVELATGDDPMRKNETGCSPQAEIYVNPGTPPRLAFPSKHSPVETQPATTCSSSQRVHARLQPQDTEPATGIDG